MHEQRHEYISFNSIRAGMSAWALPYADGSLTLYQRLIQYFSVVSQAGGDYIDVINFNRTVYPEVVSISESEALFRPEHGYGCPDGSAELQDLILKFELLRLRRFQHVYGMGELISSSLEGKVVGIGAGTTGVLNCLLPSIRDITKRETVCISLPQYSVYDGIAVSHGLKPVYIDTASKDAFLPTAAQVEEAIKNKPAAVILTFPTNPAQTTYDRSRWKDLANIVSLCEDAKCYLIVDNIYQDTIWNPDVLNPEIFAFSPKSSFLIKVWGPSKDRPGAAGWRCGYFVGDVTLRERYFHYSSVQYNTPNSASRCNFALDLMLRIAKLEDRHVNEDDFMLLGDYVASWGRKLNRHEVHKRFHRSELQYMAYQRLEEVERLQRLANRTLKAKAVKSGVFSNVVNDGIGNVLLLKVDPQAFGGSDHDFFMHALQHAKIGILPANAFGFPIKNGEAWFRMTTIHNDVDTILEQLNRLISVI